MVQGLSKIGEGGGGFGLEVALGDSGEYTAQGSAEIACGEIISEKEGRYILTSLFSGLRLRFLLGVVVAEMRVAGAARSAALAAIGKVTARLSQFRAGSPNEILDPVLRHPLHGEFLALLGAVEETETINFW